MPPACFAYPGPVARLRPLRVLPRALVVQSPRSDEPRSSSAGLRVCGRHSSLEHRKSLPQHRAGSMRERLLRAPHIPRISSSME